MKWYIIWQVHFVGNFFSNIVICRWFKFFKPGVRSPIFICSLSFLTVASWSLWQVVRISTSFEHGLWLKSFFFKQEKRFIISCTQAFCLSLSPLPETESLSFRGRSSWNSTLFSGNHPLFLRGKNDLDLIELINTKAKTSLIFSFTQTLWYWKKWSVKQHRIVQIKVYTSIGLLIYWEVKNNCSLI